MDRYRSESLSRERVSALFMLGFAGFGLLLAALGVYAVVAFSIGQRTPEIGLRVALGARRSDILPMLLARSVSLVGLGLLAGSATSLALGRVLVARLPGITPMDAWTLGGAGLVMALTGLLACVVPATRASRLAVLPTQVITLL
jgi:ABC-type antimicrobial peptide transport system permease subunit